MFSLTECDYPSGSAHWSPPVLLAHNKYVELWSPGDFASPGVETVAESGATPTLQAEIEILQTKGLAGEMVMGVPQFNNMVQSQDLGPITLSPSFPFLSTISMIAPSPDWFSGFESFSPRGPGGYWFETFEVATYPFDAGTEQGTTYTPENDAESPHGPIYQLTRDTVPGSGVFLDETGATVMPVATWKCNLMYTEEDMNKDTNMNVNMNKDTNMKMNTEKKDTEKMDTSMNTNMIVNMGGNPSGGLRGEDANSKMSKASKLSKMIP